VLFFVLPRIATPLLMTLVAFFILMCYGGGFGTMPAFTADYFGAKNVGPIYGLMLTAWSFASVFGPLYIARMREMTANYGGALHVIATVMALSILLPIIVRPPRRDAE
jgi:OFA family oxalate/formate antiporter-like MFS transporter